jgi:hypothetical protein
MPHDYKQEPAELLRLAIRTALIIQELLPTHRGGSRFLHFTHIR